MKRLSKKVIKIVNDYGSNLKNLSEDDKEFLIAQIDGVYEGFLETVFITCMWIAPNPIGDYTKDGQYGNGKVIPGLIAVGTYCIPIEGGKYLAIDHEIEDLI